VNENDAERKTMMARAIPARPKGAAAPTPPPPLDELLQKRQAAKFEFVEEEHVPEPPTPAEVNFNALVDFMTIMETLRKYPKPLRKRMVGMIAELMLE
jgi:hypothetical protein